MHAGNPYSCLMKVNQNFSSLFRHYAKHHGLRKEDLVYYFTEELQPDDTPASVHLQKNDEIIVCKRKAVEEDGADPAYCTDDAYFEEMSKLLLDTDHTDCEFVIPGEEDEPIGAHKAILTARGEYFRACFRKGGMRESESNVIRIEHHDRTTVLRMLEYIYTNRVALLSTCSAQEILDTLRLGEEYFLPGLKRLCENEAKKQISRENVVRIVSLADKYNAEHLKGACMAFIRGNAQDILTHPPSRAELEEAPQLLISITESLAHALPKSRPNKRMRTELARPAAVAQTDT